jgi:peptide/nickel transport system substrate-binding protein
VSNLVSSQLVLQRNDGYFKQGQPYLDKLTFKTIGGEQSAYQAALAGQAQAIELQTPALIEQATQNGSLQVNKIPGTQTAFIQLNTAIPPFNDKRAREAIYYATDPGAINSHVFKGMFRLSQSFTGPSGLFYEPKVPGYRTRDVAKAKQLVQQLGGLKVSLFSSNDSVFNLTVQALQSQWREAGIESTLQQFPSLGRVIQEYQSKKWQAALLVMGAYDPAVRALSFRFQSGFVYSGVNDAKLDQMTAQAAASTDQNQRAQMYKQIAKYISDNAYAPFLFSTVTAGVAVKAVNIPGVTSKLPFPGGFSEPNWDEAWMAKA